MEQACCGPFWLFFCAVAIFLIFVKKYKNENKLCPLPCEEVLEDIINLFTSRPKSIPGSRDPGITIVNPTEISVMYGYIHWRMTTEISVMYGSEGVKTVWTEQCGNLEELKYPGKAALVSWFPHFFKYKIPGLLKDVLSRSSQYFSRTLFCEKPQLWNF